MFTTRMKFLSVVLVLSLLFLIYDTYQRSTGSPETDTPQRQVPEPAVTSTEAGRTAIQTNLSPSRRKAFATVVNPMEGWGRNPFLKPVAEEITQPIAQAVTPEPTKLPPVKTFVIPELKVSAITWTSGQARALINGKILAVGDVIEGMLIMDIEEASVTLRGGGKTLTLEVGT